MTIADLLADIFKERSSTYIYRVSALVLIGWNWKPVFMLFFEAESKIDGLRSDAFLDALLWHFDIQSPFLAFFSELSAGLIWSIAIPFLIIFLMIKYVPNVINWAHDITVDFETARKSKRIDQEEELIDKRAVILKKRMSLAKEEQSTIKEEQVTKKTKEKVLSKENTFSEEFQEYVKGNQRVEKALIEMENGFYSKRGLLRNSQTGIEYIDGRTLSIVDSLGLVDIKYGENRFSLTLKGKAFLRELHRKKMSS